ncbi:MAG: phospholipase D-like domain-containing protein [Candidatus Margulisbacteria bacterium]|nr:phospholipase D-like domain-containing protein [Candidatus Margulisiibacteriota bacterium]
MRIILIILVSSLLFASQVFFSPDGGTREQLIKLIQSTTGNVDIAIYSFTSKELALALLSEQKKGRKIRLIADRGQGEGKYSVLSLLRASIPVKYLPVTNNRGMMHNKFMIINNKHLVTGSYNWSTNAEKYNYENCLILEEKALISKFSTEFNKLWREAVTYDQLQ